MGSVSLSLNQSTRRRYSAWFECIFTFWAPRSIRRAAEGSHSPKCWVNVNEGYCWVRKTNLKGRGQCQITKGHYKIEVWIMPCDTCFLGHFALRYPWWQSFDHMPSFNLTFDGGQIKFRSSKITFSNQNGDLRLLIFFDFGPKTQNLDFEKIKAYKRKKWSYPKNGKYVLKLHTNNTHTKFQSNIFIFGYAVVKNRVKVMMSLFEMLVWHF